MHISFRHTPATHQLGFRPMPTPLTITASTPAMCPCGEPRGGCCSRQSGRVVVDIQRRLKRHNNGTPKAPAFRYGAWVSGPVIDGHLGHWTSSSSRARASD